MSARCPKRYPFSEVTSLEATGPLSFRAEVNEEWTIRGKPNGGYLLAMLGRAASLVSPHDHVIAASAHYLRPPESGSVEIEVEVLRAGRSASQVRGRLNQGGRSFVEALVTTGRLEPATLPYWEDGAPAMSEVAYDDCIALRPPTRDGTRVAMMEQVEIRLEPETAGFTTDHPSGRGELRGWLSLPSGEPFDPTSLLFAVDAFPPATFDIEFTGWVPTLELTVYVRALPAPGPVRVLQRAQMIQAKRVDESCFVWDREGRLVAHGTQLAGIAIE